MTTLELRENHLEDLRSSYMTLPVEELRQRVRGLVTVQFVMSEMHDETPTAGQLTRLQALLSHYATIEELALRESVMSVLSAYDTLRAQTLDNRGSDPVMLAISLMSNIADEFCAAAQGALDDGVSWRDALTALIDRWVRTPPLGL